MLEIMGVEAIVSLKIEDGALMYGHGMSLVSGTQ